MHLHLDLSEIPLPQKSIRACSTQAQQTLWFSANAVVAVGRKEVAEIASNNANFTSDSPMHLFDMIEDFP